MALCARTSVWSRSAEQRRAEQIEVAPSTVHSDQLVLHCHSQDVSRHRSSDKAFDNQIAIMSIESDILREIDFTAIINDFAVAKSSKVSGL